MTAALEAVAIRRRRGLGARVVVPTSVRVEARWNRSDPRAAAINRLPIHDTPLTTEVANLAAFISAATQVSVADAHIAAIARSADDEVVVITSDPDDITRAAAPANVRVIRF